MLGYTILFFIMAVVAGLFGYSQLAGTLAEIAQLLAVLFLIIAVASGLYAVITGRKPPVA